MWNGKISDRIGSCDNYVVHLTEPYQQTDVIVIDQLAEEATENIVNEREANVEPVESHMKRILELEVELFKRNDQIAALKMKLAEKNNLVSKLRSSVNYYKMDRAKKERESEEALKNYTNLSVRLKSI